MDSKTFVDEIAKLRPSRQELSRPNYSDELIEMWLSEFEITKSNLFEPYDDPIIALIKCNDISLLRINDISFHSDLVEDDEYIFFGGDTCDRLAIQKSDGKIVAYDSYSGRIMFECADSSSKFLDALIEIMKFSKEKMLNEYDEDVRDIRGADIAYISALKAGGEQFEDYYKSIL